MKPYARQRLRQVPLCAPKLKASAPMGGRREHIPAQNAADAKGLLVISLEELESKNTHQKKKKYIYTYTSKYIYTRIALAVAAAVAVVQVSCLFHRDACIAANTAFDKNNVSVPNCHIIHK